MKSLIVTMCVFCIFSNEMFSQIRSVDLINAKNCYVNKNIKDTLDFFSLVDLENIEKENDCKEVKRSFVYMSLKELMKKQNEVLIKISIKDDYLLLIKSSQKIKLCRVDLDGVVSDYDENYWWFEVKDYLNHGAKVLCLTSCE